MKATPNDALRAARMSQRMSQDDLARAVREAGARAGVPNEASKRHVQRWESGQVATPSPRMARALEMALGQPIESLGFPGAKVVPDGTGGHDITTPQPPVPAGKVGPRGNLSGIWLSRYEYYSSGRAQSLVGLHYVVVLQHGDRLSVRSLPQGSSNPDSPLTMDLRVNGNVVTGTWREQTAADGYYRGAVYDGAIQMLVEPTGRRMTGKWVGFGAEMDVNTGPWELVFQEAATGKAATDRYNRPPEG